MKTVSRRMLAICLVVTMVFSMVPSVLAASSVSVPEGRVYITSTEYALVPGATETVLTTNNEAGTDQCIGFLMEFSGEALKNGTIKAVAAYKDYQYDEFGLQTVTDQAKAYEKYHSGETVIAGINADFFNMNTGEPSGCFIMDGKLCHEAGNRPWLAIMEDGTAQIRESGDTDYTGVMQAIGGDQILVRDGEPLTFTGDYASLKYSRCALGIKADGTIVTYTTHGISTPTSCGETYNDLAVMLAAQGCVIALNVDGGGSATSVSMREGTNELVVQNSPSDGTPRTVSSTLLFTSTVAPSGVFDHASLSPNNEYYTPSTADAATTVQFVAAGVDSAGSNADLPESGLTWALAADSTEMGTIDAETGLFTAAAGKLGTVNVELSYNGAVVGSTSIQLVEPEEISFSGTGVSLNFSETTDLGLTVKGAGVILNHKVGDFTWTVECTTDGVDNAAFGTMSGNDFITGEKQSFSMEGNVSATYTRMDGTKLTAEIFVEIGKMPIVAMDFEDISGVQGKNVVGLWDWGTTASYFTDSTGAAVTDQVYQFENYETLYYLQSETLSSDSAWINEVYTTEQPWTENEDGTVTVKFEEFFGDTEFTVEREETYGEHAQKWVRFFEEEAGIWYYWRGYNSEDTWSGNFNAGGGSASAFLGADGYDLYVWHTNANKTDLKDGNGTLHGEGSQIVDASEGEVRFGDYALKLTYDYTNFVPTGGTKNCNTYYRMTDALVAQGSPSGLGMWVYAPEGMSNFWFWTAISYWDGTQWLTAYPHFKPAGAEKTLQYTGINWTGWTYVEADLSSIYAAGAIVDAEHPLQVRAGNALIQMTYIPGGTSDGEGNAIVCGSKSAGYFYIDNVRWVYGTNVDDMDAPQIISAKANETALSATEVTTLTTNEVSFAVEFTDPQGENYSGIDEAATQVFLDGTVLPSSQFTATADRLQTVALALANGEHTLEIQISDNFGNKVAQIYNIVINNPDSTIPVVTIERDNGAEIGSPYDVTISVDSLENIASVSTVISYDNKSKLETKQVYMENSKFYDDYGNLLTLGSDGNYYDANNNLIVEPLRPNATGYYYVSSAVQTLGENLTGTVRNVAASNTTRTFTATATVNDTVTEDTTLLKFTLPIPATLTDVETVPVTVTVTYTTTDGNTYTVTTGKITNSVYSYYSFASGIQISGADSGTITVTANDGSQVDTTNLNVYVDGTAIDGTWEGNVFTTSYFTSLDANTTVSGVYVGDAVNGHYSFKADVYVCGYAEAGAYGVTLNATTGDSNTTQQITWLSGIDTNVDGVQVQYVTKAAYEAAEDKEAVFASGTSVTAKAQLTDFVLSGVDFVAVYVNNATITGLTPGTEYVCRAGDGETWSAVTEFSTYIDDGSTDFVVMGDAQLHGNDVTDADAIASLQAVGANNEGVDFGIQTGDFVDGGTNYTQWEQILRQFAAAFEGTDFVHTMGNHEAYTSVGTTAGTEITTRLYGLTSDQTKFYSVEYGDVYVAVINQAATSNLAEAAAWLIEDAAKTDCTWKVMVVHQPPYYTNPNGSSDGHHNVLAPACDEAGIDFVFSGHDHAYARTEQIYDGVPVGLDTDDATNAYVDADGNIVATQGKGTVYVIAGSMDPGGEYTVTNNADFHFAAATNEYNCVYISVAADEEKFTINTYDMAPDGTAELIDTYTMYTGAGICAAEDQHVVTVNEAIYNAETGMLVCERCGEELDPAELNYTGFATDVNGADEAGDSQYYFYIGALKTGWFTYGEDFIYANENGLIDSKVVNYSTETCTTSGKNKAYSPRYDLTYTGGTAKYTGHSYETQDDGTLVCVNSHCVTSASGCEEVACGHVAIDIADWNFSLAWTSSTYSGSSKTPAITIQNPETGETLEYATDGMGKLTDYSRVWANNKNVGIATVTIEANPNGDYFNSNGTVVLELKINPAAPTSLAAAASSSTAVDLSWKAVKGITDDTTVTYKVYVSKNNKWSLIGTTADTSFTAAGLNNNTEYSFAVKAVAVVPYGETTATLISGYSDAAAATTTEGISIADASVTLSYTKATYGGNGKRPVPTVTTADGVVLVKNTDYTVSYENNVEVGEATVVVTGCGAYTGEIRATFHIYPDVATNLEAARTSETTAKLTWTAAGCADPIYQIYQSADGGATWKKIADVTNATTYDATGLNAKTDYQYKIRTKVIIDETSYWSMSYSDIVECYSVHVHVTEIVNAAEATCTEAGYTGDAVCTICGETVTAGSVIPALGHSYADKVTEPTCTEKGYTTHTCAACGDSYVDAYVDATGHNYESVVTAPTCTEKGYTTYTCSACDDTYTTDEVEATGHNYESVVTAPTCTEKGYTTHTCTVCGDSCVDTYVDETGHTYDDGVVTKEPTTEATGVITYTCLTCGEQYSDILEKLPGFIPFEDVAETAYYYDAVTWAVENGITTGTSETTFSPDDDCTRAQAVTFLWRAAGEPEPEGKTCPFTDVDESAYYYKAVLWAVENGITTGTSATTFSPADSCSRAQIVTFLWRAAGEPEPEGKTCPFTDVDESAYYYKAVLWAVENDITNGVGNNMFAPGDMCLRCQVVTFLYRYFTNNQ